MSLYRPLGIHILDYILEYSFELRFILPTLYALYSVCIMATEKQTTIATGSSSNDVPYYIKDADLPDLPQPVRTLLEEYSQTPAAQVQPRNGITHPF